MSPAATSEQLSVRLTTFYADRMNIYADRGNILFLRRRCEWRGIQLIEQTLGEGEGFDPGAADLAYIGGGQDSDQISVAEDLLRTKRNPLVDYIGAGKPMLAVCGGYQLMGHSYQLADTTLEGLGILDMHTVRPEGPRLTGNVIVEADFPAAGQGSDGASESRRIVGFENHGGRTVLGESANPFGRVLVGNGNNGEDGTEGARLEGLIGTYLHGPLLPKNWWLADHLIERALAVRYGESSSVLSALDDTFEVAANRCALEAAG